MTKKQKQLIEICIMNEGFDYCFCDYSDFKDIKDDKFHELRETFIKAKEELENYIRL